MLEVFVLIFIQKFGPAPSEHLWSQTRRGYYYPFTRLNSNKFNRRKNLLLLTYPQINLKAHQLTIGGLEDEQNPGVSVDYELCGLLLN